MAYPALSFINIGAFSFAWEALPVMRHFLSFTHVVPLPFQCTMRVFNKFLLRGNAHPVVVDGVGSWVRIISFLAFLGNMYRLNATRLAFRIRSKVGGHFLYVQILQSFQIPKPPSCTQSFHYQCNLSLREWYVWSKSGGEGTTPSPEALGLSETQDGVVRARETETQDSSPLSQGGGEASSSFSQNPKQVLVASDFWCDGNGVSHRRYHPLSLEHC